MKSAKRLLAAGGVAVTLAFGGVGAKAVPIDPVVSFWTLETGSLGIVPDPTDRFGQRIDGNGEFKLPPDLLANTVVSVSNPDLFGAESADGRARIEFNDAMFNKTKVKSGSKASTANDPASVGLGMPVTSVSFATLNARLSNPGAGAGEGATVDLTLNVKGSLIYTDPSATASAINCGCGDLVPDMSTIVTVILALAPLFPDDIELSLEDLADFDVFPLFYGTAILGSIEGGGAPQLTRYDHWDNPLRDGDFQLVGPCTAQFCRYDVSLSLVFPNVESLGFGDEFHVGLVLATGADELSDPGRSIEANFFDTVTFEVALTAVPTAAPAPGSLLLLGLGLLGMAAVRRRRLH